MPDGKLSKTTATALPLSMTMGRTVNRSGSWNHLQYRLGLDRMTENTDTARMAITESIEMLKQRPETKKA